MIGLLYSIGREVYRWLPGFMLSYTIISTVLYALAGDYVYTWLPQTPVSALTLMFTAKDYAVKLMAAATTAVSMLLGLMSTVGGFLLTGSMYLQMNMRSIIVSMDSAVIISFVQFLVTLIMAIAKYLGPAMATIAGGMSALIVASVTVYYALYATGAPPP